MRILSGLHRIPFASSGSRRLFACTVFAIVSSVSMQHGAAQLAPPPPPMGAVTNADATQAFEAFSEARAFDEGGDL